MRSMRCTRPGSASLGQAAYLERVVVTTSGGDTYDLGRPTSPLFRLRVLVFRLDRKRKAN